MLTLPAIPKPPEITTAPVVVDVDVAVFDSVTAFDVLNDPVAPVGPYNEEVVTVFPFE
mgnify:CR=1 FL=1